jgi:phosphoesterase RecJ-like protein
MSDSMKDIMAYIEANNDFFIATHLNPDGDALGSALALHFTLQAMGKRSQVYNRDGVPSAYAFLPRCDCTLRGELNGTAENLSLILLDCNIPERAGLEGIEFKNAAVIDHHATERDFGSPRWVDPGNPATGLMIFRLIRALDIELTADMAINLYAAMAVDTGTFRFPSTTSETLRAAADLLDAGASPGEISERLYQDWSSERFSLLLRNLSSVIIHGAVALTVIPVEMFASTKTTPADTENFVNFPLIIMDVRISALMREVESRLWRVSLRSKGNADVSKVAESFDGGGHVNAAGCTIRGDLEEVKQKLIATLSSLASQSL